MESMCFGGGSKPRLFKKRTQDELTVTVGLVKASNPNIYMLKYKHVRSSGTHVLNSRSVAIKERYPGNYDNRS